VLRGVCQNRFDNSGGQSPPTTHERPTAVLRASSYDSGASFEAIARSSGKGAMNASQRSIESISCTSRR